MIESSDQPTELELHRMDHEAIRKAGFESPGELLAAYNMLKKKHTKWTDAQISRLWCNSPNIHLDIENYTKFKRLVYYIEMCHEMREEK